MNPFLILGSVLLVIMILLCVFDPLLVNVSALFRRRAGSREDGNENNEERRATRKWIGIWTGGVFALIFLPGLLAHLEFISDKYLALFPLLYMFVFGPTVGRYATEVAEIRKNSSGTEE